MHYIPSRDEEQTPQVPSEGANATQHFLNTGNTSVWNLAKISTPHLLLLRSWHLLVMPDVTLCGNLLLHAVLFQPHPSNPAPSPKGVSEALGGTTQVTLQKRVPHAHLSAVSHPKTCLKESTDLHVAQVGNRHDSHFRDIVTTAKKRKQMTTMDCVAV